ncbi:hypothetical protein [Croceitalea rosinachiae]|uniref:Fibronectin type-III domain-containing protein n=1 Tax=Croceitalea rosinachiae TaxID=3075596 RepID=A0ABU3A7I2_9FLAO|nr:hypothetical protein [Croceitalea sp. F388]MDT0605850.1 hypothetical protein [Croceitalea sp. F388]
MKRVLYTILLVLFISCGNDDGPPPSPEGALLIFPDENSECTTGISVNEELSQVTFEWMPAKNADLYTLTVINLNTNAPQAITSASTSVALSIEKGAPFSWSVTSSNTGSDLTATSDNWLFYNSGSQTTYAPFPAQLIVPKSGATVQKNSANEVSLEWFGADVEDDIEQFEVYFSEQNPPNALLVSTNGQVLETNVTVISGTTYYWKVITTDAEGNSSDSGVFDFKVL